METGIIYKITNKLNNKVYIGLTTRTLDIRWKEHLRHSSQKIDAAITEFGARNFTIELIEECNIDIIDNKEQYWIQYYNSFDNGYNLTAGGRDDKMIFMPIKIKEVKKLWDKGYNQKKIVDETKLNVETVHNYLVKSGVTKEDIRARANIKIGQSKAVAVNQYDLKGNFIKTWNSITDAARNVGKVNSGTGNISMVCKGKRGSAYGYKWKYANE